MTDSTPRLLTMTSEIRNAITIVSQDEHADGWDPALLANMLKAAWKESLAQAARVQALEQERELIRQALIYYDNAAEAQSQCPFCLAETDEQHGASCPVRHARETMSSLPPAGEREET